MTIDRRQFLKLSALGGGAVLASSLPGCASLGQGAAQEDFYFVQLSDTHWGFNGPAVNPDARIGDEQLPWLKADLERQPKDARIVVLTHRPLFDLAPEWDWATRDGAQAIDLLMPHSNVTVFYGHIHQENHHMTGHIAHHSAKSLIFPLPAPKSQPKRDPVKWDAAAPYKGLGFREIEAEAKKYEITELPVVKA